MKKQQSTTSQEEQQERQEQEFKAMLARVSNRVTTKMELMKLEKYNYKISDSVFDKMNKWESFNAAEWEALLYDTIGDMPSAINEVNGLYVFHTAQKDGTFRLIPAKGKKNKQIWVETPKMLQMFEKTESNDYKLFCESESTRTIWLKQIDSENVSVGLKLVNGNRILFIAFIAKNRTVDSLRNEKFAEELLLKKNAKERDEVVKDFFPEVSDFWEKSTLKEQKEIFRHLEGHILVYLPNGNYYDMDVKNKKCNFVENAFVWEEFENEENIVDILAELSLANKV